MLTSITIAHVTVRGSARERKMWRREEKEQEERKGS
jgi:hypothetical protein